MRIEPEHAQLLASGTAMTGHGADGACSQCVVAAQQDGQSLLFQYLQHCVMRNLVPVQAFGQIAQTLFIACAARVGGAGKIAQVADLHAKLFKRGGQLGNAQGIGPHGCAKA